MQGLLSGNGVSADVIRSDDLLHGRRQVGEDGGVAPGNGTFFMALDPSVMRLPGMPEYGAVSLRTAACLHCRRILTAAASLCRCCVWSR